METEKEEKVEEEARKQILLDYIDKICNGKIDSMTKERTTTSDTSKKNYWIQKLQI